MVRSFALALVSVTLSLPAVAGPVNGFLDFSGDICGSATAGDCGFRARIGPAYGDVPGLLDITFDSNANSGDSDAWWGSSYGSLDFVAYASPITDPMTVKFVPLNGATITLNSFSLAYDGSSFDETPQGTVFSPVKITDESDGSVLYEETLEIPETPTTTLTGPWSSDAELRLVYGPDAVNVGISNISYTVTPAAVVPLPPALGFLAAGVLGLVTLRRRRASRG